MIGRPDAHALHHDPEPHPTTRQRRMVVFSLADDEPRYRQRARGRAKILAMQPTPRISTRIQTALPSGAQALFWALMTPNGITPAIAAQDFDSVWEARDHCTAVYRRAAELITVPVQCPKTGIRSWWLVLDGRVAVVAGRTWNAQSAETVERAGRSAQKLLSVKSPWGELGWQPSVRAESRNRLGGKDPGGHPRLG